MEKNVRISILLDTYGKLLTDKQYKLLNDYYNNDLSLSEIAENENITRQAVRDNLKKGENNILEYEDKLKLMKEAIARESKKEDILKDIIEIENKISDKKILEIIEKIKNKVENMN